MGKVNLTSKLLTVFSLSRFSRKRVLVFLALCPIAALGQACSDKSLQDYDEQQAQKDLATQLPAQGHWRGLVKDGSGAALGDLEIDLTAQEVPQASSDSVGTDGRAQLSGALIFQGPSNLEPAVDQLTSAYYDPTAGSFNAQASITDSQGHSQTIVVAASISGNTMGNGALSIQAYPNSGGSFTLIKEGDFPSLQSSSLSSQASQEIASESGIYYSQNTAPIVPAAGTNNEPVSIAEYKLNLVNEDNVDSQKVFLSSFSTVHGLLVDLSWRLVGQPSWGAAESFTTAELDGSAAPHTLIALGTANNPSSSLQCNEEPSGFTCHYEGGLGSIPITFGRSEPSAYSPTHEKPSSPSAKN